MRSIYLPHHLIVACVFAFWACDLLDEYPSLASTVPTMGASMKVDASGGMVTITDPASPLFGAILEIPPDAVDSGIDISISVGVLPEGNNAMGVGSVLSLSPDGRQFNLPVTVTVPLPAGVEPEGLGVSTWDGSSWQPVDSVFRSLLPRSR